MCAGCGVGGIRSEVSPLTLLIVPMRESLMNIWA